MSIDHIPIITKYEIEIHIVTEVLNLIHDEDSLLKSSDFHMAWKVSRKNVSAREHRSRHCKKDIKFCSPRPVSQEKVGEKCTYICPSDG